MTYLYAAVRTVEMTRKTGDAREYVFLTAAGASLDCRFEPVGREVQLFGNRAGLLSLANVLLWLHANPSRELLSLGELPFVHIAGTVSVYLRIVDARPDATAAARSIRERASFHGTIQRVDKGESFEWMMLEDELRRVSLVVHALASRPYHEYDRLVLTADSDCGIHLRMTDAVSWL